MCTEFVNPYSYGCTTTQICLKLEYYKHLTFFFFLNLHVQSWHPYTHTVIFEM